MICEVCGMEYEDDNDDLFDLCEECQGNFENEVDFIRQNIDENFGF